MNNDIPVFRIDNVVEYYMLHEKCDWKDADFANVTPPYERFVMIFTMPKQIRINGKLYEHPFANYNWQTIFQATFCKKGSKYYDVIAPEDGWFILADIIGEVARFQSLLFCNKSGKPTPAIDVQGKVRSSNLIINSLTGYLEPGEREFYSQIYECQTLALYFLNHKDVTRETVEPLKGIPQAGLDVLRKCSFPQLLEKYYTLNIEDIKDSFTTEQQIGNLSKISMMEYEVGKVVREGVTSYKERVEFDFLEYGAVLNMFFKRPTEKEIEIVRKGRFKIGLVEKDGILFIICKFGSGQFMDAPYNVHLSAPFEFMKLNEGMGYALNIHLIDSSTGILKVIRLIGLSTKFSRQFKNAVEKQRKEKFDVAAYDSTLKRIYNTYSTKDLAKWANVWFRI